MSGPVWTIGAADRDFPACLLELGTRTPPVLYGTGDRELVSALDPDRTVTIVGSRRSGRYGLGVTEELGYGAGAAGMVVVSGWHWGAIPRRMRGRSPREGPPWRSSETGPTFRIRARRPTSTAGSSALVAP